MGGLIDDVIFSTAAGDDVTAVSYDSADGKMYVGVTSDEDTADYIARVDVEQHPSSR